MILRVLVVEDHPAWLTILKEDLEELSAENFRVTTASSLDEAITHLKRETYHVVVTDIGLTEDTADIGGIKLLEWLKINCPITRALAISGRAATGFDKEKFKQQYHVLEYLDRSDYDSEEFVRLVERAAAESKKASAGQS